MSFTLVNIRVSVRLIKMMRSNVLCLEPEEFDVCPVLLTQPEKDRWTPQHLSGCSIRRNNSSLRIDNSNVRLLPGYSILFVDNSLYIYIRTNIVAMNVSASAIGIE